MEQHPKLEDDALYWKERCLQLLEENVKLKESLYTYKVSNSLLHDIVNDRQCG